LTKNTTSKENSNPNFSNNNNNKINQENFNFLKGIPGDLIYSDNCFEDKLIFEDQFREMLIIKNLKYLKICQAESIQLEGDKEIKESFYEIKAKLAVDELLDIVDFEEIDGHNSKIENKNFDVNQNKEFFNFEQNNKFENQQRLINFFSNNSQYKNETLYQDHNITMILKMSQLEEDEENHNVINNGNNFYDKINFNRHIIDESFEREGSKFIFNSV